MPNHVTNIVEAPREVIVELMDGENPTFKKVAPPSPELEGYERINSAAETAAESICGEPLSDNPMLAALQASNRQSTNVVEFDDRTFEQFVSFVSNKRNHGYYHIMDFARNEWGTKWGPYSFDERRSSPEKIVFDTAWSCPIAVFKKLSVKFPNQKITVSYADEDIGSNCGVFKFLAGEIIEETRAEENDIDWVKFACEVTGTDYSEYMDEQ